MTAETDVGCCHRQRANRMRRCLTSLVASAGLVMGLGFSASALAGPAGGGGAKCSIDTVPSPPVIDAGGSVLWTADGIAVCAAGAGQTFPRITSDGSHGAIVIWSDQRNDASVRGSC